jgi:hypothetical protein
MRLTVPPRRSKVQQRYRASLLFRQTHFYFTKSCCKQKKAAPKSGPFVEVKPPTLPRSRVLGSCSSSTCQNYDLMEEFESRRQSGFNHKYPLAKKSSLLCSEYYVYLFRPHLILIVKFLQTSLSLKYPDKFILEAKEGRLFSLNFV